MEGPREPQPSTEQAPDRRPQLKPTNDERAPLIKQLGLLSDIAKLGVVVAVVLYGSGFVIWHSYLGQFGITPHGFFRTEFLSAACCYFLVLTVFAVPAAFLYGPLVSGAAAHPSSTKPVAVDGVLLVWAYLLMRFTNLVFPTTKPGYVGVNTFSFYVIVLMVIHLAVLTAFRKRLPPRVVSAMSEGWIFPTYILTTSAMSLWENPNVNRPFVIYTVLLYPAIVFTMSRPVQQIWKESAHGVRFLITITVLLVVVSHLHSFAIAQFKSIPKNVGGGRPEFGMLSTREDLKLSAFFAVPSTNGVLGPVAILLHSENEVVFVAEAELNQPLTNSAKMIPADQLLGIRYLKQIPPTELISPKAKQTNALDHASRRISMPRNMAEPITLAVTALSGGAAGAIITWFATSRRERRRDREQRKREFAGYLAELRSRVERIPHTPERVRELFDSYTSLVHQFHRERAKVRDDFAPVEEFDRLAGKLGGLRYDEIQNQQGKAPRDVIAEAIDDLIRFTANH